LEVRDVLDEAVRCLAVGTGSQEQRLVASGKVLLAGLSREDFSEDEDRELFDRVGACLNELHRRRAQGPRVMAVQRVVDLAAESLASDIVDLRDTVMGRALRDAGICATRRARRHPRR
jgi:hypothetical protein